MSSFAGSRLMSGLLPQKEIKFEETKSTDSCDSKAFTHTHLKMFRKYQHRTSAPKAAAWGHMGVGSFVASGYDTSSNAARANKRQAKKAAHGSQQKEKESASTIRRHQKRQKATGRHQKPAESCKSKEEQNCAKRIATSPLDTISLSDQGHTSPN